MKTLQRWLDDTAARTRATPLLEESLLGERFASYLYHRLRFVVLGHGIRFSAYVLEVVVLFRILDRGDLGASLIVRNLCLILAAFWWGALDALRIHLREHSFDPLAAREIDRWLGIAARLSATIFFLSLLFSAGLWLGTAEPPGVVVAYSLVVIWRLALDLVVRTFYSGVYAHRRVYRPMLGVFLVEVGGFVTVIAAWPWLGSWSLPIALAVSTLASRGFLFVYTRRAYESMRSRMPRVRLRGYPRGGPRMVSHALLAGVANASTRIGSVVVLVLLLRQLSADTEVRAIHMIVPLLALSGSWSQVFYLDFKRLEDSCSAGLRRLLEQKLNRWGIAIGAAISLLALGVIAGTGVGLGGFTVMALAALFVAQSHMGQAQLRYFALARYQRLVAGFLVLAAGCLAALLVIDVKGGSGAVFLLSLAGLMGVSAEIMTRWPSSGAHNPGSPESLFSWLGAVAETHGPVRVGVACMKHSKAFQRRAVECWLRARLGNEEPVVDTHGRLIWCDRSPVPTIDRRELAVAGAGLIENIMITPWLSCGRAAVQWKPLTRLIGRVATAEEDLDPRALIPGFRNTFPQGVLIDLESRGSRRKAGRLDPKVRQEIWREAKLSSRERRIKGGSGYDVTALVRGGEIAVVFAVPRDVCSDERTPWRHEVHDASWLSSAGSPPPRHANYPVS